MPDCIETKVAGLHFGGRARLLHSLKSGDALALEREADNPHDPNAIKVISPDGEHLGYLPREMAVWLAEAMDGGTPYLAMAAVVNPAAQRYQDRLSIMIRDSRGEDSAIMLSQAVASRLEWEFQHPEAVSYVFVDLETTGLSPKRDEIIEIGAVRMQGNQVAGQFNSLVKPEHRIPPFIEHLTGITNSMVKNQPRLSQVLPEFLAFAAGCTPVAHNASFDMGFLEVAARRCLGMEFQPYYFCTCRLARRLVPGLTSYSLGNLVDYFGFVSDSRHRAMPDVNLTIQLWRELMTRLANLQITTLGGLRTHLESKPSHSHAESCSS